MKKEAITFRVQAAQGDLWIRRVDAIPATARSVAPTGGRHVVAHSETGHHHYVGVDGVDYLTEPEHPLIAYLRVDLGTMLEHDRAWDTHAPISLPPGSYELRRAREYVPNGWRRVED